jgi:hypothetical protein
VVHQQAAAVIERQEKPLTTGFVVAHAVWQLLKGLTVTARDSGGAAVRKQKPRHWFFEI